ncbi:MAG: amino acid permease [Verrucomicrobia bacterium]|nr:amino acid permease [Verrucomicrobiota bacterium]
MDSGGVHRPRNVGWRRAAALLYGDWGTSKAYVIGLVFTGSIVGGYASLPIILAVCALTALVGYNYVIVCKHFPDGGGVYSAARLQGRTLAVIGALLLLADFIVTAAMSAWDAMSYFGVSPGYIRLITIGVILVVGVINYFGPKHSGSIAVSLAVPTVVVVVLIILFSAFSEPGLTFKYLEKSPKNFSNHWVAFVGSILALSGVEAIANLTGVLKLDPGSSMEKPRVHRAARKAILIVAVEVVLGTAVLGWAMLSIPSSFHDELLKHKEDMIRFVGEHYGELFAGRFAGPAVAVQFGHWFGFVIGLTVGLLLLSAVNTAGGAMIGLIYLLARDGEMPRAFARLNSHGVPWWPLVISLAFPIVVVLISDDIDGLAGLYAIGVVGAITVNLGSCCFNLRLALNWFERAVMGLTFAFLAIVEVTLAHTKHDALFFIVCVLIFGLTLRSYALKRAGLQTVTVSAQVAAAVAPEAAAQFRLNLIPGQTILVAARGWTPVLQFALEEARLRQANLYVLYVKELAVSLPAPLPTGESPRWQDDARAAEIMYGMLDVGRQNGVTVIPLYAVSENPASTILDLAATMGADTLILGSTHRSALVSLLKGNVVTEVARSLPENIRLLIFG